jgi:hypothetical protein
MERAAPSCAYQPSSDAWSRAAARLIALEAEQGRTSDRASLTMCDVRDLHALVRRSEMRTARARRPASRGPRLLLWLADRLAGPAFAE